MDIGRVHCPAWLFIQVAPDTLVLIVGNPLEIEIVSVDEFAIPSQGERARGDKIARVGAAIGPAIVLAVPCTGVDAAILA